MENWKQSLGPNATYNKLISVFERAGYQLYANTVGEIVKRTPSELADSSSDDNMSPPMSPTLPDSPMEQSHSPSPVSATITTALLVQEDDSRGMCCMCILITLP